MAIDNSELKPRITVIGVGGAGGNAVCNMIRAKLEGVEFLVANTDAQALNKSLVDPARKIQLGYKVTEGLGAGSKPDVGRASAEESINEILQHLRGSNMVFITCGMGGGTGTGAAPVIARAAREEGILTVGVVTKPFHFEGTHRSRTAERGIEELQQHVDTLIIIPNQNLFRIANERTTFEDAFKMADDVLYSGVRGVTDLIMFPGLINLDFADIRSVMAEMGKAMMGTGEAVGDKRAIDAAESAISNPLLDDVSMKGAKGVLINITGGYDMTLYEVDEAANRIRDEVDPEANIIFGSTFDEQLNGSMRVSVFATGIGSQQAQPYAAPVTAATPAMARPISIAAASAVTAAREAAGAAHNYGTASQPAEASAALASPEEGQTISGTFSSSSGFDPSQNNIVNLPTDTGTPAGQMNFDQPYPASTENGDAAPSSVIPLHPAGTALPSDQEAGTGAGEENLERRRAPSLFERFTGVARTKTAPSSQPLGQYHSQSQGQSQALPQGQPQGAKVYTEETPDLDMLEIPAFLRRGT